MRPEILKASGETLKNIGIGKRTLVTQKIVPTVSQMEVKVPAKQKKISFYEETTYKIFANLIPDKGLASRVHEELKTL